MHLLDRCAVPSEMPERQLSPNNAYWFVTILPDRTENGPWDARLLEEMGADGGGPAQKAEPGQSGTSYDLGVTVSAALQLVS